MNGSKVGTGKHGQCREVTVVEIWRLVEFNSNLLSINGYYFKLHDVF